jgi:hypothetical protein
LTAARKYQHTDKGSSNPIADDGANALNKFWGPTEPCHEDRLIPALAEEHWTQHVWEVMEPVNL